MFWRLGWLGAWRNLARSTLAILSMAMAAGFLTYAISMSRGYAFHINEEYRSLVGGEIAAYDLQFSGQAPADDVWYYQQLTNIQSTDLTQVMPALVKGGYMTTEMEITPFSTQQQQLISQIPTIKAIYPRYQIPALSSGLTSLWSTPLRGRDLILDDMQALPTKELVAEGRWFEPNDEGSFVAVVSAEQHLPPGQPPPAIGDRLQVLVPRIVAKATDIDYDLTEPLKIELTVIGIMDIQTRTIVFMEDMPDGSQRRIEMPLYAQCDEIQIPLSTWRHIWQLAGGNDFSPRQMSIMVDDLSYLEDTVVSLQNAFPEHTFISVPQLLNQAVRSFNLENPTKLTLNTTAANYLIHTEPLEQNGMALDLRLPMSFLIFINAAMVIAANLLIMVSERKTEMAILKAVGSTRRQIIQMVLAEAFLVSGLGALSGFLIFRLPGMFNQISNQTPLFSLLLSLAWDLSTILLATSSAALIFGMLPAMQMANLSVREITQTE